MSNKRDAMSMVASAAVIGSTTFVVGVTGRSSMPIFCETYGLALMLISAWGLGLWMSKYL